MVNGTTLNFGKRYKDNLRVIFDQYPKLHIDSDVLSYQKTEFNNYQGLTQVPVFLTVPKYSMLISGFPL